MSAPSPIVYRRRQRTRRAAVHRGQRLRNAITKMAKRAYANLHACIPEWGLTERILRHAERP